MKLVMRISLCATSITLMAFGCADSSLKPNQPPVEISYRVLNLQGEDTRFIQRGDNFILSLMIVNKSTEDWYIDHTSVMGSDFTRLYRKEAGVDSLHFIGSAYISSTCSFQAGVVIPVNGTYRVDVPWIADKSLTKTPSCGILTQDNSSLPVGQYTTNITSTIKVFRSEQAYEIPLNQYNVNFNIK